MPARLLELLASLRHPETGCPWDKEQTPQSLCEGILDEAYELVEAVETMSLSTNPAEGHKNIAEEAGDLLFQLMFVISLYAESGQFTLEDVVKGVEAKMIRRHPHVFGDESAENAGQVLNRWEQIKLTEGKQTHPLDSVPRALPALARTRRLWSKAKRLGWVLDNKVSEADLSDLFSKVLQDKDPQAFAQFLFKLVVWGNGHGLKAEDLLREANLNFQTQIKALFPVGYQLMASSDD